MESAIEDESELSEADCTASPEEGLGLAGRTLSIGLDLSFSLCDLHEKLLSSNQHLAMILNTSHRLRISKISEDSGHTISDLCLGQVLLILGQCVHQSLREVWH